MILENTFSQSVQIKNLNIQNRFVMAPMTRMQSPGGVPTSRVADYYERRAQGNTGLIITEGTLIPFSGALGYSNVPHMYGEEALGGWQLVTERVHEQGSKIFCQLWHVGSYKSPDFDPEGKTVWWGPSRVIHPGMKKSGLTIVPQELKEEQIEELIQAYVRAAQNAEVCGFDGVELHAAHGYLLDQFFWKKTNHRSDRYGGDWNGRTLLCATIIKEIKKVVSKDFVVGVRFSQWKLGDFEYLMFQGPKDLEFFLEPLTQAGCDFYHVSTHRFENPAFEFSDLTLSGWTKRISDRLVIAVGGVGLSTHFVGERQGVETHSLFNLEKAANRIEQGEFDMIAIGRSLIADPEFCQKVLSRRESEMIPYQKEMLKEFT